jgi:cytosine permease
LVLSGQAGNAAQMFGIIGASFGPICGAMTADYLLAGCKWPGPRAGFNPAGWISWAVGFFLGSIDMIAAKVPALSGLALKVPCPPVAAIIVGFVLYFVLAKVGLTSKQLEMPTGKQ